MRLRRLQIVQSCLSSAAVILSLCVPFAASAAEFSKSASPNGGPDIIFVVGDFNLGDEKQFIKVALSSESAIVVFQSRGGNLVAGIEIGKAIHLKGFATFVPDTIQCASACALAWLGGHVRYMSNTARVGFHAVYIDTGGQASVSSAGNALVGAYLNQLGLPASAIIYITGAPPEGMQWLNFADAQHYGIDVRPFDLSAQSAVSRRSSPRKVFLSQVSSVKKEVYEYFIATNRANGQSLSYLEDKLSDQVDYYGKLSAKAFVLKDKKAFFRKWPVRNYSVEPPSVTVACKMAGECIAKGIFDWEASGPILRSKGSATFRLGWTLEGTIWKISAESSQPIKRKITRGVH